MSGSGGQTAAATSQWPSSSSSTVRVTINGGGTIVGRHQAASADYPKALDLFYGIPYGEVRRRFRPAVGVSPPGAGATLRADVEGPTQPSPTAARGAASETGLRLTIVRPGAGAGAGAGEGDDGDKDDDDDDGDERRLPVVVYVHGGAFNFGDPLERDLAAFVAWAPRDLLVVAIEYRLGALGFVRRRDDDDDDDDDDALEPGNLGLEDQRLALAWTGRWAGAFGGRTGDVTLMGVSAGAHSVGHHLLSPAAPPVAVAKAVLESGSPTARSVLAAAHARPRAQLASLRAHAGGRALARLPLADVLDAAAAVWLEGAASACWPFQPVVDGPGGFIPREPARLWADVAAAAAAGGRDASRRRPPPAVVTGFCSHEGTQFVPQHAATNADFVAFFRALMPGLDAADVAALEALYPDPAASPLLRNPPAWPARRFGRQYRRLHEAYAHYAYVAPVLHTAHVLSRAGARVYLYEYAALARAPGPASVPAAAHADHAPVVAHDMAHLRRRPGLEAVARAANHRWAAFAAHPAGELDPRQWPLFVSPFGPDPAPTLPADHHHHHHHHPRGSLLVFGRGNDEAAGGSDPGVPVQTRTLTPREMDQCRFWWDRMELSQGMGVRADQ